MVRSKLKASEETVSMLLLLLFLFVCLFYFFRTPLINSSNIIYNDVTAPIYCNISF